MRMTCLTRRLAFSLATAAAVATIPLPGRAAASEERAIVVFVDDVASQPVNRASTVAALTFVRDVVLRDTDWFGAVSTGRSSVAADLGADPAHQRLDRVIDKLLGTTDGRRADASDGLARYHTAVTLATLRDVITGLTSAQTERQRQVIVLTNRRHGNLMHGAITRVASEPAAVFTPSWPRLHPEADIADAEIDAQAGWIFSLAARSQVTVRVVDSEGFAFGR
jgi:hypothetical protein